VPLFADTARLYAASQLDAIEHVVAVVAQFGIDCDLERRAAYTYVTSAGQVERIRAEVDAASAAGLPASFVTDTALPFDVAAAIRVDGQAQFHPRRYLLVLAEDLTRHCGRISQDNVTTDRVPFLGRFHARAEHVWVAAGFNA